VEPELTRRPVGLLLDGTPLEREVRHLAAVHTADGPSKLAAWDQRPRRGERRGDELLDLSRPSASRVYDHWLGGVHTFGADRDAAAQVAALDPLVPYYARANRGFLFRAVSYLLDAGVRQFVDLGCGISMVGCVHEIAQRVAPQARVLYVDIDPIAVQLYRQVVAGDPFTAVVRADLRRPETVLRHPQTRGLVDLAEPVGLLAVGVLHFVPDGNDPAGVLTRYRQELAAGSYLALSHACPPEGPAQRAAADWFAANVAAVRPRSRQEVSQLLTGWELVAPGLVELTRWRPDPEGEVVPPVPGVAAVARLPGSGRPVAADG